MAAVQLSFLDDSGLLRPDCISRSDAFCALCGSVLPPRKRAKKLYWLGGRPPRRICRVCSSLYVKCFDERIVVAKRGGLSTEDKVFLRNYCQRLLDCGDISRWYFNGKYCVVIGDMLYSLKRAGSNVHFVFERYIV